MALLLDSDYEQLRDAGLAFDEDAAQRFFVFLGIKPQEGQYNVPACDVLVVIPPNYPQAGNDMFWTHPRLHRSDGRPIPAVMDPGGGDNRIWKGREFCRWSRHWGPSSPGGWRPGKDDIMSIYRRIEWALKFPDGR
ncbi:MAG: E2/UBC family protein [Sulfuricaulis sp.]